MSGQLIREKILPKLIAPTALGDCFPDLLYRTSLQGVGVNVAVGVAVGVAVDVRVGVEVNVAVGVLVIVGAGGIPRRTIRGYTQMA
jgi:hypothetical protein